MNDATVEYSAARLRQRLGARAPKIAVLLGSGWASVTEQVHDAVDVPYAELETFPAPGVGGHAGLLRAGRIGGVEVVALSGRQHGYETGRVDGMNGAIRTLAALGVRVLLQTNAAGSLDPALRPGDLMLVGDHLNLPQLSPLVGEAGDRRFVDMSAAYDPALRRQAAAAAARAGIALHEGVYAWALGPQFETPAEIRWLRLLGARAVGMSTVPETIAARHAGLRVLALSMITNMGAGMDADPPSHARTLAVAGASEIALRLLLAVIPALEI